MSKVWRTWKRFRERKGYRRGPLVLALVALDLLTKWALVTQGWAWHTGAAPGWGITVALYGLLTAWFVSSTAGILLVSGAVGNGLSALHGPVANPFTLAHWNLAFNAADLYLLIGFAMSIALLQRRRLVTA